MQRAWIICTGTELTLGDVVNSNAQFLAARLAEVGIRTERIIAVPDDLAAIRDSVLAAARCCDVILVSGGLGPTSDDLTRAALAQAVGVPLVTDPAALEHIRAFFEQRGRPMPAASVVQAQLPSGARALPNACGTAPGVALRIGGTPCYALPGVPFELQTMFIEQVLPELRSAGIGHVLLTRYLHCFGAPESEIGARIADLMQPGRNPSVGTRAEAGIVSVRISAFAESPTAADQLLDQTEHELRQRLGTLVFGRQDQSLASVVGEQLAALARTLATAESCTGGLLGELVTSVPGSSRYYLGGLVTYSNALKTGLLAVPEQMLAEHGAVSAEVAEAMAAGARRVLGSDYAVSITGIAGPEGGTQNKPVGLVYIGLCGPDGVGVSEFRFGATSPRSVIRLRAAYSALDLLRRELLRATRSG